MTREEAIERLKNYTQYRCGGVDLVALNMAIQALEQEPCNDTVSREVFKQVMWERDTAIEQLHELGYGLGQKIEPCGDCVSRQAVLNKAFEIKTGKNTSAMVVYAEDIRKELPVLPKREQGEWIINEEDESVKCPSCGGEFYTWGISTEHIKKCPNCGAEMR